MSAPPDIEDLARRYLALWDRQAVHLAMRPAEAALLGAFVDKMTPPEPCDASERDE